MKDVTAAIFINSNKVFIARRAPGQKMAGGWEFPGGKVEANETPEQCLERELFEELGIVVKTKEFFCESIYAYPHGEIRLLAYVVERVSGRLRLCVHDEYQWVELASLLEYPLLPADIPIAQKIIEKWK